MCVYARVCVCVCMCLHVCVINRNQFLHTNLPPMIYVAHPILISSQCLWVWPQCYIKELCILFTAGSKGVFEWKRSVHSTDAFPSVRVGNMLRCTCSTTLFTRAWRSRNWCSDYWVEYAYLRGRTSILSKV